MSEGGCPLCDAHVGDALMCPNCRYPVNVRPLADFGPDDLSLYIEDLGELSAGMRGGTSDPADDLRDDLLGACVAMDWLRPESVIFNYRNIRALQRHAEVLVHPSVDLGCGTGAFTTMLFGGRFHVADDSYGAIDLTRADAYDVHETGSGPRIATPPRKIGIGVDLRESMVERSRELGVYDAVHHADVRRLPLADGSVASAVTNMFDDLPPDGLCEALREMHRVLRPGGHGLIVSPDEAFRDALVYHGRADAALARGDTADADRFRAMDRGRSSWVPRDEGTWRGLLAEAGLEPVAHETTLDESHMRFWDVGWRPLFPWTVKLRAALRDGGTLGAAKPAIVEFVRAYVQHEATRPATGRPAFSLVVARRPR